jgi:hypothetical protein
LDIHRLARMQFHGRFGIDGKFNPNLAFEKSRFVREGRRTVVV